jgi:acyl-CoA reductase-like NAD-dependent aldehyde dehydrogenase
MSTDIIMVHKDIANEFLQTLKQTVMAMQASSESLPVVVSLAAVSRIAVMIEDATKKGGEIFHGGLPPPGQKTAQMIPTVIGGLSNGMNLWTEEAFGPLVGYRLFSDEAEAVKLANSPGYGLSASVFTRDLRKAFALAKKLESGYGSGTLIKKNLLTHPKAGPY